MIKSFVVDILVIIVCVSLSNCDENATKIKPINLNAFTFDDFPVILRDDQSSSTSSSSSSSPSSSSSVLTNEYKSNKSSNSVITKRLGNSEWRVSSFRKGRYVKDVARNAARNNRNAEKVGQQEPVYTEPQMSPSENKIKTPYKASSSERYNTDSSVYEGSGQSTAASNHYEYNSPDTTTVKSSYGYRARDKDPEYNSPQNYEDYGDTYNNNNNPPQTVENDQYDGGYQPNGHSDDFRQPITKTYQSDSFERDTKPTYSKSYSRPTFGSRPSYLSRPIRYKNASPLSQLNSQNGPDFLDLDNPADRSWLTNLFGAAGNKYRSSRNRNPIFSTVTTTNEIPLTALSSTLFETPNLDGMSLLNLPWGNTLNTNNLLNTLASYQAPTYAPSRPPSWFDYGKSMATNARPLFYGPVRPYYSYPPTGQQMGPPPPPPPHGRGPPPYPYYSYGSAPSSSNYMPMAIRPMGPMMPAPSMVHPLRVPYPGYMSAPAYPPPPPPMYRPLPPIPPPAMYPYSYARPAYPEILNSAESSKKPNITDTETAASRNFINRIMFPSSVKPAKASKRMDTVEHDTQLSKKHGLIPESIQRSDDFGSIVIEPVTGRDAPISYSRPIPNFDQLNPGNLTNVSSSSLSPIFPRILTPPTNNHPNTTKWISFNSLP